MLADEFGPNLDVFPDVNGKMPSATPLRYSTTPADTMVETPAITVRKYFMIAANIIPLKM